MSTKDFKIKLNASDPKHGSRNSSAEPSGRNQAASHSIDQAKIVEKLKNDEPTIDFRRAFEELKTEVLEMFSDFQSFIVKEVFLMNLRHINQEDIGTRVKGLLETPQQQEPIPLVRCIKHTLKSIVRLREEANQQIATVNYVALSKQKDKISNRLETDYEMLLQKAEQDIKNHIRVAFVIG